MPEAFYSLDSTEEISCDSLEIPRAQALCAAVHQHRFFRLLSAHRSTKGEGGARPECLVVEVECDGVPGGNAADIRFVERLVLGVDPDNSKLVVVQALRRDFPVLIHQNQTGEDSPPSLCLYFEPTLSVNRTWTPQNFLRRIQWWLEKSARGELHPADQPVEELFFESRFELILPWDLDALRTDAGNNALVLVRKPSRPDKGWTAFLQVVPPEAPKKPETVLVTLELPGIVQGEVERNPVSLGQLDRILSARGLDLLPVLTHALQEKIGGQGEEKNARQLSTVILLAVPVLRMGDTTPEGVSYHAFFVPTGHLDLGVRCGALFEFEKKYYPNPSIGGAPLAEADWREVEMLPMSVSRENTAEAFRKQSGIVAPGPVGTLVGAGALGSALLNFWIRSGWGAWTVVDKDHVQPHNLTRHTAYGSHIGDSKVVSAALLGAEISRGAVEVKAVFGDAMTLLASPEDGPLTIGQWVIDASSGLEYPRAASHCDSLPRHFSVFITPDGLGGVLLAEDTARHYRLRTLEAQYYRALITQPIGDVHLTGEVSTFWSGTSCRDISTVLPYTRLMQHASTLAEQLQRFEEDETPAIRIWQRDPARGDVVFHEAPVCAERAFDFGELTVYLDGGVEDELRRLRAAALPCETGGVLLGYHDFNVAAIVILMALPAPPDSVGDRRSFQRGTQGLAEAVARAATRTQGVVGYLGEWHSHPDGHSANQSPRDVVQLRYLAQKMTEDGLPAVQLIVGERDIKVHGGG